MNLREAHDPRYPAVTRGDFLTFLHVKEDLTRFETQLWESKWWDYRFLTPIEATITYIDAFGVEARKVYAREFDEEKAQHVKVATGADMLDRLKNNKPNAKERFSGFWRGRACADAIGMPYPIYINWMMEFRMRLWKRRHLPLPNQLYGEREIAKVVEKWKDVSASRIRYAEHPAYSAENWQGAPAQVAYANYLIDAALARGDIADFILRDMVRNGHLAPEALKARIGHAKYAVLIESRSH